MKKRAFRKLYQELFYIPKYEKLPDKVFRGRMVLSLLTILACTAAMAVSTFALFFSKASTDPSTLAGAYYSVTVDKTENGVYVCPLAFEDKHTFEIKATGTATTGYCKIQVGTNIYYTEQILQGQALILTVQAAKGTPIVFTPGWGTLSENTCGNEIIHSATPSATYIVEPAATLDAISAYYGISKADILTYNRITEISVNMPLNIPGVSPDTPPYIAPVPAPPASTDENAGESNAPPTVENTPSGGAVDTGEQPTDEPTPTDTGATE